MAPLWKLRHMKEERWHEGVITPSRKPSTETTQFEGDDLEISEPPFRGFKNAVILGGSARGEEAWKTKKESTFKRHLT